MKKTLKPLCILTAAVMIISVLVLSVSAQNDGSEEETSALELPDDTLADSDFIIRIVHTNDIHARIEENESSGIIGAARLKTVKDSFIKDCDMSFAFDSGDLYHGLSIATVSQGESVAEVINAIGYDAITVGNHDWNYGQDRLLELVEKSGTVMLAGNVVKEDGEKFFSDEFLIKEVEKDGKTLKVGVFGVIDPEIYRMTSPKILQGLTYTDAAQYANEAAKALRDRGCDVVIALSHAYTPDKLAEKVSGVDIWIVGHEHMLIDTTVTDPDGKTVPVYEDGYYLYGLGCYQINVDLTDGGVRCDYEAYHLDYEAASAYEKAGEIVSLLDEINQRQSEILQQKAGYSPSDLDGVWEDLRIGQTNLGGAVTSAYILLTGADVAFENAGGIRASVSKGDLTYGDIIGISPFGNLVVTKKVSGSDLLSVLEDNIELELQCIEAYERGENDSWPRTSGSYIQFGGMTVTYDPSLENGHRIISVYVKDKPLDPDAYYTVATNNFFADSANIPLLAASEKLNEYTACEEALISYFSQDAGIISADVSAERAIKTDSGKTAGETVTDTEESETSPQTGEGGALICVMIIAAISVGMLIALIVSDGKSRSNG